MRLFKVLGWLEKLHEAVLEIAEFVKWHREKQEAADKEKSKKPAA